MMHLLSARAKQILLKVLMGIVAFGVVAYVVDDLSSRLNIPSRDQFSTITIRRSLYVNEKYNKFSLEPLPDGLERCVNALMPHFGSRPCWYVRKHTREMIEVN